MKVSKSEIQQRQSSPSTTVFTYPSDLKELDVARIKVKGRNPYKEGTFFIEHKCHVLCYIIKGSGKVIINGEEFKVKAEDTITIPAGEKYFIEGNLDYIAACSPAYFKEQNEIVEL